MKPPFKGNSTKNLYDNICRGKYSPIPKHYSEKLGMLISKMIVVDVRKRANIHDLINFLFDKKRIKGLYEDRKIAHLISTIKMPRDIRDINEKLPKARYEEKEFMKGYDRNNGVNRNNNGNNYNVKPKIKINVRKNGERYNQNNNYNNHTPEIFLKKILFIIKYFYYFIYN